MPLDNTTVAAMFGFGGMVLGKVADVWLGRLNSKDTKTVTLTTHMSEQSKLLFEQLGTTIKDTTASLKEVTTDRNQLQTRVFHLEPLALKMQDFDDSLQELDLTMEDALSILREAVTSSGGVKRRWYERRARSGPTVPLDRHEDGIAGPG